MVIGRISYYFVLSIVYCAPDKKKNADDKNK